MKVVDIIENKTEKITLYLKDERPNISNIEKAKIKVIDVFANIVIKLFFNI